MTNKNSSLIRGVLFFFITLYIWVGNYAIVRRVGNISFHILENKEWVYQHIQPINNIFKPAICNE